jgi:hypothetical protein
MKNGTLLHPEARAEILRRIEALTPRSEHALFGGEWLNLRKGIVD